MLHARNAHVRRSFAVVTMAALLAALVPVMPVAAFTTYIVNASDDTTDGTCDFSHCSLREAIDAANASPGGDEIQFSSNPFSPLTITIQSELPAVTEDVTITVSGFEPPMGGPPGGGGPATRVRVQEGMNPVAVGLRLTGGVSTVRGLEIGGFDIGILVESGAAGSRLERNLLGGSGFSPNPNGLGVEVQADGVIVGGPPANGNDFQGRGNEIRGNTGAGVLVSGTAVGVNITRNDIADNGGLGIDLAPVGQDTADDDDADNGPNGSQNAPVLTTVETLGMFTTISGTLESTPSTTFQVEVYASNSCDATGFGEGGFRVLDATVMTDMNGVGSFSSGTNQMGSGGVAAAIAIAPDGSTSEFGNCIPNTLVQRSDMSLGVTAVRSSVGANEAIQWTWTLTNNGPTDATGVTFTQTMPAGVTFERAQPGFGGPTCSFAAPTLTCSMGTISASFGNQRAVVVDARAGGAGAIVAPASVTADQPDNTPANDTATSNITVLAPDPKTLTVNSLNDASDGTCNATHCSLREAINAANTNPGRDTIAFSVAGTISPSGLWPQILGPTVIDGRTAPGYVGGPRIELNGTSAFPRGIWISGGDSEVWGLAINRWNGIGIYLDGWGNNVIKNNGVGVDPTGSIRRANSQQGIMAADSHHNVIGGPGPNEFNVVTGNSIGIHITGAGGHHNVVQGNIVGLAADGSTMLPGEAPSSGGNAIGISVHGPDNLIGGPGPGEGNLASANNQQGISVGGSTAIGNIVQGNIVGLNANQTQIRKNDFGIEINGAVQTLVGGPGPGERNVVAGNLRYGVIIWGHSPNPSTQTTVEGNRLGTNDAGAGGLGNGNYGVYIGQFSTATNQTLIGGTTAGTGNVIAYNIKDGVFLESKNGARVLGNSIHSNGELGIDNNPNGITTAIAFREPSLTSSVTVNGTTTIGGGLSAASASTAYRIELFSNAVCDLLGRGEGEVFLGFTTVTTNGSGNATFAWPAPSPLANGAIVTATSTNPAGDISEFSNCVTNGAPAPENASGSGATGTTTTTDSEGDGATSSDPIETSVTVPASVVTPGAISIAESSTLGIPPANYTFFGSEITITAPIASAALPLVIVFDIDAVVIPAGETAATVAVLRNGVAVPACTAAGATPDPCVALRETVAGGDIRLTIRTSQASVWNLATFQGVPPAPTPTGTNVTVVPTDETTGTSPVTVTFATVTAAGGTTLVTSGTGPANPAGYRFGVPATFYELSTTATFSGQVTVCIQYSPAAFQDEGGLRLFHRQGGAWVDVTTSLSVGADRICGAASSLGTFAIAERTYPFGGFLAPVDPLPTVNRVKAGQAVPVTFSLGGNLGLAIFRTGFPASQSVACDSHLPVDEIETTVTAGQSSLQYDPATGRYTYVWKTDKAWSNSCRRLTLTFKDGTTAQAMFNFTK